MSKDVLSRLESVQEETRELTPVSIAVYAEFIACGISTVDDHSTDAFLIWTALCNGRFRLSQPWSRQKAHIFS